MDGSRLRATTKTVLPWCWNAPWPRWQRHSREDCGCGTIVGTRKQVLLMRLPGIIPALALAAMAALPQARAAERVTLTNGFVESCNHHANVDSHVRLYLNAAEDSYIDFAPDKIASIETVADPAPKTAPA